MVDAADEAPKLNDGALLELAADVEACAALEAAPKLKPELAGCDAAAAELLVDDAALEAPKPPPKLKLGALDDAVVEADAGAVAVVADALDAAAGAAPKEKLEDGAADDAACVADAPNENDGAVAEEDAGADAVVGAEVDAPNEKPAVAAVDCGCDEAPKLKEGAALLEDAAVAG